MHRIANVVSRYTADKRSDFNYPTRMPRLCHSLPGSMAKEDKRTARLALAFANRLILDALFLFYCS